MPDAKRPLTLHHGVAVALGFFRRLFSMIFLRASVRPDHIISSLLEYWTKLMTLRAADDLILGDATSNSSGWNMAISVLNPGNASQQTLVSEQVMADLALKKDAGREAFRDLVRDPSN